MASDSIQWSVLQVIHCISVSPIFQQQFHLLRKVVISGKMKGSRAIHIFRICVCTAFFYQFSKKTWNRSMLHNRDKRTAAPSVLPVKIHLVFCKNVKNFFKKQNKCRRFSINVFSIDISSAFYEQIHYSRIHQTRRHTCNPV